MRGTHTGAAWEELHPMGKTHTGAAYRELSAIGGTPCWSKGRV